MRLLLSLVLLLPALLAAQTITPIANIQDSTSTYDGTVVTIEAVVTIGAGTTNNLRLNAFVQDGSGKGMMLFDHNLTTAYQTDIVRGNRLQITGTVDEYNGVTELASFSYTVQETGVDISPYIVPLSLAQADDAATWEGTLAQVSGELYEDPYSAGGGTNLNLEDNNGDRLTVRVWDSTGISYAGLAQGSALTAVGAVNIYSGNTQVLPGYQEDLTIEVTEEPVISGISYTPSAPTVEDPINVSCTITDADGTIEEAFLEYRLASGTSYTMVDMDDNGNTYCATIPAMNTLTSADDNFIFRITAEDDDGNSTTSAQQTVVVSGGGSEFTPIATIQDNIGQYNGQEVDIQGVVTIGAGVLRTDQLNVYIQDESGRGLQLYASSITGAYSTDLIRGNMVQVTGTVEEYNGTTEVTSFTYEVVATGVDMTNYTAESTISGVADYNYWEGTYVKLPGLVLDSWYAGGGQNITLVDDDGNEITARIWDTTGIDYSGVADGDNMIIKGIVSSYSGASQISPGYQEDLLNLDNPIATIEWTPEPAFAADTLTVRARIEYTTGIAGATLAWAQASTGVYTDVPMTYEGNNWYVGTVPPMASLTGESDNFLVRVSATTAAGASLQSAVFTVPVYTGAPIFDDVTIDSDAMAAYGYVHYPFVDEPVSIVATIHDLDGTVDSVAVMFGLVSTGIDSAVVMSAVGNNKWSAELPPMTDYTTLDDDYIVFLAAMDNDGRTTLTETMDVTVAPRCPIVGNVQLTASPEPGEELPVKVRIYDTDGSIVDDSAMLWYTVDYKEAIYTLPLVQDDADSTVFTGVIAGRSGGTTVHVNAEAEDYAGNAASEYPDWNDRTVEFTWPVRAHTAVLKIPPTPFDPYHGETIPIDYFAMKGDKVLLRIYSAEGKLVHTPQSAIVAAEDGVNRYEWDGRNRARRLLPLGIYICHLEVTSADGGNKKTDRAPIVIGAPLQ